MNNWEYLEDKRVAKEKQRKINHIAEEKRRMENLKFQTSYGEKGAYYSIGRGIFRFIAGIFAIVSSSIVCMVAIHTAMLGGQSLVLFRSGWIFAIVLLINAIYVIVSFGMTMVQDGLEFIYIKKHL